MKFPKLRNRRLALALVTASLGGGLLAGCSQGTGAGTAGQSEVEGEQVASEHGRPLVVAMELAYPPFETKDDSGTPDGVSVQFMKDFADAYHYDLTIENTSFDGLIPMLQTGKADAVMSSMTITQEREQSVDFSDPYARAQLAILANSNAGIASIDDLNQPGRTVAVKTGSTGDIFATKNLPEAQVERLADESAAVTEVVQGKADGFLYDQLTIYRNQARNPDTTDAVFIPFQEAEYWGIAVAKGHQELLDELNQFIADYAANGGFADLTEKYLADEHQAFEDLGFTWFFDLD